MYKYDARIDNEKSNSTKSRYSQFSKKEMKIDLNENRLTQTSSSFFCMTFRFQSAIFWPRSSNSGTMGLPSLGGSFVCLLTVAAGFGGVGSGCCVAAGATAWEGGGGTWFFSPKKVNKQINQKKKK